MDHPALQLSNVSPEFICFFPETLVLPLVSPNVSWPWRFSYYASIRPCAETLSFHLCDPMTPASMDAASPKRRGPGRRPRHERPPTVEEKRARAAAQKQLVREARKVKQEPSNIPTVSPSRGTSLPIEAPYIPQSRSPFEQTRLAEVAESAPNAAVSSRPPHSPPSTPSKRKLRAASRPEQSWTPSSSSRTGANPSSPDSESEAESDTISSPSKKHRPTHRLRQDPFALSPSHAVQKVTAVFIPHRPRPSPSLHRPRTRRPKPLGNNDGRPRRLSICSTDIIEWDNRSPTAVPAEATERDVSISPTDPAEIIRRHNSTQSTVPVDAIEHGINSPPTVSLDVIESNRPQHPFPADDFDAFDLSRLDLANETGSASISSRLRHQASTPAAFPSRLADDSSIWNYREPSPASSHAPDSDSDTSRSSDIKTPIPSSSRKQRRPPSPSAVRNWNLNARDTLTQAYALECDCG